MQLVAGSLPRPSRDAGERSPGAARLDRLVIMHGISSRVLRGVMTGAPDIAGYGAPALGDLPQGSVVMIAGGVEHIVHTGRGGTRA